MKILKNILFLGCGKMGSIIVNNLLEEGLVSPNNVKVIKKTDSNRIAGISYLKDFSELENNYKADLVFIAIKPQDAKKLLQNFANEKIITKNTIFISILAGKKIEFFENIFGKDSKIIRSMPNLPIQYSQGIFPYFKNKNILNEESIFLESIFKSFGESFEIKQEEYFDFLSAIFGSGPAYIFLLQEILTKITIEFGLDEKTSTKLVKKLLLGSSLMSHNSKSNFRELRESVTSKAGITEAALDVLQKDSLLENIFRNAINSAIKRSKELGDL